MKTQNGFTLLENPTEFKNWLDKQKVTRTIKVIQEHHTATRIKGFNGSNHFAIQTNMKTFHTKTNGWSDIAQQFTIFPDGTIMTGRSLNTAPAGIVGANANGICIENYGWFDKNYDTMPQVMKDAIVAYTRILLDRFNLTPSSSTITYHGWWTAKGVYLGTYTPGKSCKTCPGDNFFGGNTITAFNTYFLPAVKAYTVPKSSVSATVTKTVNTTVSTVKSTVSIKKAYSGEFPKLTGNMYLGKLIIKVDTKDNIKNTQTLLKKYGYYKSTVDGVNGTNTKAAINNYRADVLKLQKFLNWYGNYGLILDSSFGDLVAEAVEKFQKENSLVSDKCFGVKSLNVAKTIKK